MSYIDLNQNNLYDSAYEPTLAWQSISTTLQALLITFPPWAGGLEGQAAYNITDYAILTLFSGILRNPMLPGTYPFQWKFTAIDPVSGGAGTKTREFTTEAVVKNIPSSKISLLYAILYLQILTNNLTPSTVLTHEFDIDGDYKIGFAEFFYIMSQLGKL